MLSPSAGFILVEQYATNQPHKLSTVVSVDDKKILNLAIQLYNSSNKSVYIIPHKQIKVTVWEDIMVRCKITFILYTLKKKAILLQQSFSITNNVILLHNRGRNCDIQ